MREARLLPRARFRWSISQSSTSNAIIGIPVYIPSLRIEISRPLAPGKIVRKNGPCRPGPRGIAPRDDETHEIAGNLTNPDPDAKWRNENARFEREKHSGSDSHPLLFVVLSPFLSRPLARGIGRRKTFLRTNRPSRCNAFFEIDASSSSSSYSFSWRSRLQQQNLDLEGFVSTDFHS